MKPIRILTYAVLALLGASIVSEVNAAAYKLADKTGASIAAFRDDIVNINKEIGVTMDALNGIVTSAATDPRKSHKQFNSAVPKVDSAARKAQSRAQDIKSRGEAYFKQWEKELTAVNNPDIRKLAEERKAELQAAFASIKTLMEPARDQFNPWLSDLKDLNRLLSSDLTVNGIDSAKSLIGKARTEGQAIQETMSKVVDELNTIVAKLTPAKQQKKS